MAKATKAEVAERVEAVLRARLDGAQFHDIRQYAAEKEWGVSERQLWRYVAASDEMLAQRQERDRGKLFARHVAQRQALYARAVKSGNYRVALAAARDEAELLCLYGGAEPHGAHHKGEAIDGTAGVVKVLAVRLQLIEASGLSVGEKAKLTATLADALLRAIGVDVLEKRLAAIEAVLRDRKVKEQ
jgi:hypothetical protein